MHSRAEQLLIAAIDIPLWLDGDHDLSWRERQIRDRQLRIDGDACSRVLSWWAEVEKRDEAVGPGATIARLLRRLRLVMAILGGLSGFGLASAVFSYDGSRPINVLVVLACLVVLPLVLMLGSFCLPLLSRSQFAHELNISAGVLAFLRRRTSALDSILSSRLHRTSIERLMRWHLIRASQVAGLSFALAALAVLILKISFSDLAFAWSSSLNIEAGDLARWIHLSAQPWAAWLGEARPSLELIEHSRFYRLESDQSALQADIVTGWWPFLALCLLVYGFMPRAIALVVAHYRSNGAAQKLLLGDSEVNALLDRLDAPLIRAQSPIAEVSADPSDAPLPSALPSLDASLVIYWNGARDFASESVPASAIDAGGERSLASDLESLASLGEIPPGPLRVVTKAWEPPLLEFHDYLRALRERCGPERSLVVQTIGIDAAPARAEDVMVWRRSLANLGDPKVYVL